MKKLTYLIITLTTLSCGPDFLDVKPSSNTVVPTTLEDFQQLLDYGNLVFAYPDMLDVLADDYYLEETYWSSRSTVVKNAHIWADDIFETIENDLPNWERSYSQIFYANVVLEGVDKITKDSKNQRQHNQVKGTALFLRAWALYNLAQLYAPAYHEATASQDLGVPIPLKSDVNEKVRRNSVHEVYDRILEDLEAAVNLIQQEIYYDRPSKAAAYALRSRVLLVMGRYREALTMANNSLKEYNVLVDLNTETLDYKKTLYLALDPNGPFLIGGNQSIQIVDEIYLNYEMHDLRKDFYRLNSQGKPYIRSLYGLSSYHFRGLDTNEQYLIKAECLARLEEKDEAMQVLNYLLRHRYSTYIDKNADSPEEALDIILLERRKELIFRGVRWSDLKRYNRDGANITLTRTMGDKTYVLQPNSDRWLFPLPSNEIKTSGISQNPR